MLTRICVAAALVAACQGDRAPSADDRPRPQAPSPASPAPASDDRQPVAGSEIVYRAEDGHENAITDPVVMTALQQKLARDGLYRGAVDGLPSSALADAVRSYKDRNQLGEGAVIDHTTSNRLGLDWSQVSAGSTVKKDLEKAGQKVKSGAEKLGQKVEDATRDLSQDLKKK